MTTTATPHTTRCSECGRPLRSAASIALGRGPVCDIKARRRAAAQTYARAFKNAEAAANKALRHLADKALIPTGNLGQYHAVASAGDTTYLVDTIARTCTCKAHDHHGRCTHLLAADVTETTTARRRDHKLAA